MRNLKRALSLALASVMLMGMMVVGSSAKDFTDADKIDNKEAVAITTGLGIFDGRDDGSFGAKDVVTRAEAAVVIAKILHGADVDPSNFVGTTKFTDVPAWAEGWVNLAASLNIIVGYGDGKFGPNDPVTTVQFTTMLLKALGYYTFDGALDADWALTVTSKATALGMYGDLVLPMNEGLTRENVAQLTWNALWEQRVAYEDYRGIYVKADDRNVVVTNGTEDDTNTLADDVFGLMKEEGLQVVENGAICVECAQDGTTVFDDGSVVEFATGIDMIGHDATVYYTVEKDDVVVYAVVDEASLAAEATYTKNLTNLAKNNGFNRDTAETVIVKNFDLTKSYTEDEVAVGTPVILVSNNADKKIDYIIALEQYVDYVDDIDVNDADEDDITTTYEGIVRDYSDDTDAIVIGEIKKGDFILVTETSTGDYIIEAAKTELAYISEIDRDKKDHVTLYNDGVAYEGDSTVAIDEKMVEDGFVAYALTETAGEYVLVFDSLDRVIGLVKVDEDEAEANVAYIADFGWKINTEPSLKDAYRMTAKVFFADGTKGVYYVEKDELFNVTVDEEGTMSKTVLGTKMIDELLAGLYDVTLTEDNTLVIKALTGEVDTEIVQIKNKVTKLGEGVFANSKTQFWFVDDANTSDVAVKVITGIANVPTVFKANDEEKVAVDNVYNVNGDTRGVADALVIYDFEEETSEDGIFLYTGKYTIKKHADSKKHDVIYKLYDVKTGEAATLTYTYKTYALAKAAGEESADIIGFVEDGGSKVNKLVAYTETEGYTYDVLFVDYEQEGDETTIYTAFAGHDSYDAKIMDEKTIFVDLTGNGMEDCKDIESKSKTVTKSWEKAAQKYVWADGSEIEVPAVDVALAYVYSTKTDVMSIIFVIDMTDAFDLDLHDVVKK